MTIKKIQAGVDEQGAQKRRKKPGSSKQVMPKHYLQQLFSQVQLALGSTQANMQSLVIHALPQLVLVRCSRIFPP